MGRFVLFFRRFPIRVTTPAAEASRRNRHPQNKTLTPGYAERQAMVQVHADPFKASS